MPLLPAMKVYSDYVGRLAALQAEVRDQGRACPGLGLALRRIHAAVVARDTVRPLFSLCFSKRPYPRVA